MSKNLACSVSDQEGNDFKAICQHHGVPVNRVRKMLVRRVVDYSERLPAAMEEYENNEPGGSVSGKEKPAQDPQ